MAGHLRTQVAPRLATEEQRGPPRQVGERAADLDHAGCEADVGRTVRTMADPVRFAQERHMGGIGKRHPCRPRR